MKLKMFAILFMTSPFAVAAIPTKNSLKPNPREQALYEQLAGKPTVAKETKVKASAAKALVMARQSRSEKNYILAIKRYNFILKYYSKTPQAKSAWSDKAAMYKEMGLTAPAAYSQKKVSAFKTTTGSKPAAVKR